MAKALVIVESPAKSKTISKFLGAEHEVASSMGHIIDLPAKSMGVDVEKDFEPEYVVISQRKKILSALKKQAKGKEDIYLATDPDREGEAISWHLGRVLGEGKKVHRVEFHEITKHAIEEAFKHPRDIDMNLVNAQQARRILDRIVGYSLSPLLWKKVTRGLSAGRVQSVAVYLIVERERQIRSFVPQEFWTIEARLSEPRNKEEFVARLEKIKGEKADLKDKDQVQEAVARIRQEKFIVSQVRESKKKRNPGAPFTTSKLQQEAFNKLRFPVNKTMRIAQQLYEGIEVGEEGPVGLITYMRTDSVRVAAEAQEEARGYVSKKFGKDYLPSVPVQYKSKKSAQDAHEAIRPTSVLREPEAIKGYLTPEQYKLYDLIWRKFVASQMAPALILVTTADIDAGEYLFRASGSKVLFEGFSALYGEDEEEKEGVLPQLAVNDVCELIELKDAQHFTKPPARYTDGSLVKALEEKGIGRPSTYAPIIQTIVGRNYVRREAGTLHPTELGEAITDLLVKHFPKIMDVKFTAGMEEELDLIEEGKANWVEVLRHFYAPFTEWLSAAQVEMKSLKKEQEVTQELCPECNHPLVVKWSRAGKFLSCSQFPKCRFAKSLTSGVKCPAENCGGELVRRRSKRGMYFYGCSNYPKCTYITRKLPDEKGEEEPEETGKG